MSASAAVCSAGLTEGLIGCPNTARAVPEKDQEARSGRDRGGFSIFEFRFSIGTEVAPIMSRAVGWTESESVQHRNSRRLPPTASESKNRKSKLEKIGRAHV